MNPSFLLTLFLIAICIISGIVIAVKKGSNQKETKEAAEPMKCSIPGVVQQEEPKPREHRPQEKTNAQKSVDELYAEAHNMWICGCCETLNSYSSAWCVACGSERQLIGEQNDL